MPQFPSLSRQARVARGTIRLALWVALAGSGVALIPGHARTRIFNEANLTIQAAINAATTGIKP